MPEDLIIPPPAAPAASAAPAKVSDGDLLRRFVDARDQSAFRHLVDRHASWVYAVALRGLNDPHQAEDAAQVVFILLARRAASILKHQRVTGWLFMTIQFTVHSMKRTEHRRCIHETRSALEKVDAAPDEKPARQSIADALDAALARLGERDRTILLLRFYQDRDFPQIAAELRISEAAARKRLQRALDRLRSRLGKTVSSAALTSALAQASPLPPSDLSLHLCTVALTPGSTLPASLAAILRATSHLLALAKFKVVLAVALIIALLGATATATFRHNLPPPVPPRPLVATLPPDTRTFDQIYGLPNGEVLRRIRRPFGPARDVFTQSINMGTPDSMIITWTDGKPLWSVANWGRGPANPGAHNPHDLIISILHWTPWEVEGDQSLRFLPLSGDFAVRGDASFDQLRQALASIISEELGTPLTITRADVPRPIHVISGTWRTAPLPPTWDPDHPDLPHIDLLSSEPSPVPGIGPTIHEGTLENFRNDLQSWMGLDVFIEIPNPPARVVWRFNYSRLTTMEAREELLQRVASQTNTTLSVQTRTVPRLILEPAP